MNWEQAKAILWLRWRLSRNGFVRAGPLNTIVSLLFAGMMLMGGLAAGAGGVFAGWLALAKARPEVLMLVWDGVICVFLLIWFSGLLVEIQRSESIDLGKLLHLPLTLQQVFVFNYLASHLTPAIVILLPGMLGLCAGLILGAGLWMVPLALLVLAVIFMITAWTYCLRGWLAALMVNKRRRRAIIVWATVFFILLSQLPNLLVNSNLFRVRTGRSSHPVPNVHRSQDAADRLPQKVLTAHLAVPPGWLGYGAMGLRAGNPWPAVGAIGASFLLGGLGLLRAYRMTLRFYQGAEREKSARLEKATKPGRGTPIVEWRLPGVPDDTAALALATFRSLTRAPELKMALIMPFVMAVVLVSTQLRLPRHELPALLGSFAASAAAMLAAFSFAQAMSNVFGLDRDGFRALVLLPTERHRILLAKNLAYFPFVGGVALALMTLAEVLMRMPLQALLAGLLQVPLAFMLFSLACNVLSVLVPYRLSQATLKAKKPKPIVFAAVFASMLVLPLVIGPVLVPGGLQALFRFEGWAPWLPVNFLGTVVLLAGTAWLYRSLLPLEGRLLQRREHHILKEVTEEIE